MAMFKIYRQIKSELVYHCIFVLAKYKRVNHSYFLLLITRDNDTFILSGAFLFSRHCTICFHFNLFFFQANNQQSFNSECIKRIDRVTAFLFPLIGRSDP